MNNINLERTLLQRSLNDLQTQALKEAQALYIQNSDQAIAFGKQHLPHDVWEPVLKTLESDARTQNWKASFLNPIQRKLHDMDPASTWIPRWLVPAHPDIVNEESRIAQQVEAQRRADEEYEFWSTRRGSASHDN